jgi:beta-galactosidase
LYDSEIFIKKFGRFKKKLYLCSVKLYIAFENIFKRKISVLISFLIVAMGSLQVVSMAQTRSLFDSGWQFTCNGKTINVDLPHDWDIYEGPDPVTGATGTGGGWYPGGKGEYRKTFKTPNAEVVKLHFEGVYQKAEVFINGQKAGQHAYGYTPFTVDITPYLRNSKNEELNEVVVKVNNSEQPNCRWYSGSGIYRHVWLVTTPKRHIDEQSVYVTTPDVHTVNIKAEVVMEDGKRKPIEKTIHVENPHLWSPDDPYLYHTTIEAEGDVMPVTYGIRTIEYTAEKGFLLNGKKLLINGACLHHDDGVLGAMAFDAAEIRKVRLMKEAGFNLIRTSHNPTTRAFLDACDSIGMLVIGEAFDGWRTAKTPYDYSTLIDSCYREDIHAMVQRDRNHPSIICWSIGNEVIERKDLRVVTTAKKLKQAILEMDGTRPVTEALCAWDSDWEIYDPHFDVLDIGGYNYMIHKHKSDHERNPKRVMWQTESYPRDAFKNWALVQEYPYVIGDIVWTGLDYLGESGIGRYYYQGERPGEHYVDGGQPDWHGAYCGDVDITGWRKPISHYREMLWGKTNAALYMAVREPDGYRGKIRETAWSVWPTWESWNWAGWEGKPIDVEVYTKASEVKLYLNDKLVGTKVITQSTEYKAVFQVPYEPGTLRAEAGGKSVSLSTAGEPARLRLTADCRVIKADGQDLAFITVEVVDSKGNICPDAAIPCEAIVKGQGSLLSFASANLKDREPYTSPRVTTWKGRALLVVRSTQKKGNAQISIKSNLPTSTITINSK